MTVSRCHCPTRREVQGRTHKSGWGEGNRKRLVLKQGVSSDLSGVIHMLVYGAK